ncbi:unnamed protein product [Brassica oleracea var. botrytis]
MHHFSKSTAKNPTRGEGEAFNDSSASRNHSDLICREETSFLCDSANCLLICLTLEMKFLFSLFTQVKLKPKGTTKL